MGIGCNESTKRAPTLHEHAEQLKKKREIDPVQVALLVADKPIASPAGLQVRYRSWNGQMLIVVGPSTVLKHLDSRWRVAVMLGTDQQFNKVGNAEHLIRALSSGGIHTLDAYITIDTDKAPKSERVIREALVHAGVQPQTISAEVVTAKVPIRAVASTTALNWVYALQFAPIVVPRSRKP